VTNLTEKFVKLKHIGTNKAFNPESEKKPLMAVLSSSQFKVLACIASYQTVGGHCDSSLGQLSEATGMTEKTISKALWELNDLRYNGKQILKVWEGEYKNRQKLFFQLLDNPLFSVYELESDTEKITVSNQNITVKITDSIKETSIEKDNNKKELEEPRMRDLKNKDIIAVFCDSFEKKYVTPYKRNYKMDNKFTTQFLKAVDPNMKNNEVKRLVEIIVENYESWSNNTAKYPLTIRTLTLEWVRERAMKEMSKEKENVSQIEKQSVEATKRNDKALSSIMARIKNKGGTE
jgi:hypothetical protein